MAEIISDKKGADIIVLDTGKVSTLSDYFVIATVESERQAQAVVDEIEKKIKLHRKRPLAVDGTIDSGWVLLDYGSVIAHIFNPGMRDYYNLEDLWSSAPVVVRMQ
ncbi:ribosome silencing factor [Anaerolineae bacterium CFX7]|nr:ribosome silencing factor [Anaerolineae bacterium CFX7]RIK18228.1 MAG: ribosome silencing factor [Chloroflexota bacterium]